MNIIYQKDMLEKAITATFNKINNKYLRFLNDVYNYIEECASEGYTAVTFYEEITGGGRIIRFNNDIIYIIKLNYYWDWLHLLRYTGFKIDLRNDSINVSWQ